MKKCIAIYPGSFDPVTYGHLDIIERASRLFDELIVAVAVNPAKRPLFSVEEREAMLKESCAHLPNVRVDHFDTLLVDYARRQGAQVIIRGLRVVSDFEFELQMAHLNREQAPEVETVFIMTNVQYSYLSSSVVKEIASFGGDIRGFVPEPVWTRLLARYRSQKGGDSHSC